MRERRLDDMALSILLGNPNPLSPGRFASSVPEPFAPVLMPSTPKKQPRLPRGMIEMYSPESDFMEMVTVKEGSPEHIKMLRAAEAMEPGSREGKALRKMGLKSEGPLMFEGHPLEGHPSLPPRRGHK